MYLESGVNAFTNTLNAMTNIQQQKLRNKLLEMQNQEQQMRLQNLPESMKQALKDAAARNDAQAVQTALNRARIPYTNAQTAQLLEQTKESPLMLALKQKQTENTAQQYGPVNQYARLTSALPTQGGVRQTFLGAGNNAQTYNAIAQLVGQQALSKLQGIMNPSMQQGQQGIQQQQSQQMNQQQPAPTMGQQPIMSGTIPDQSSQVAPQVMPQSANQPVAQPMDPDVARFQRVNQLAANQALTSSATRKQLEGAEQAEAIMASPLYQNQMKNASEFAGLAGKGKAAIAAASQTNPEAYEDYLSFGNQTLLILSARIRSIEGLHGTDKQTEELKGLYKSAQDSFTSNPAQFMTQMNNLKKLVDMAGGAVQTSASPIFPETKRVQTNQQSDSFKMPEFKNKQEFQSWYNSQSPENQARAKMELPK